MQIDSLLSNTALLTNINFQSHVNNENGFLRFYSKSDLLRRAASQHSWTRATGISIGRAAIGSGFSFVRHPIFGDNISKRRQKEIEKTMEDVNKCFFAAPKKTEYIQDMVGMSAKMFYTANSFMLYGQATWEKVREKKTGKMIGFDSLPGITMPNVDSNGKFRDPAYLFRPWNSTAVVPYKKNEVVYFSSPGLDMSIYGSSDYDSLIDNTIPSDIYASKAYKHQFENINAPYNGVWVVDPSTSEEDYLDFLALLANRYTGIESFGSNPLVIRGQAKFEEHRSRSNDDAPYLEGRRYNQEEMSAVTGISSAKLGVTDNASKTNHRELRREFHENTLRPIFAFIEESIYNQVLVQEFDLPEFKLAFNRPDLSTALEEATIIGRYIQNGVYSPNEGRIAIGKPVRTDEFGDKYFIPSSGAWTGDDNIVKSPLQEKNNGTELPQTVAPKDAIIEPINTEIKDSFSDRVNDMVRPPAEDDLYTDTRKSENEYLNQIDLWKENNDNIYVGKNNILLQTQSIISDLPKEDINLFINVLIDNLTN